jgi:3-oxoacyl-ACP reductase-like protein
LSDRLALANVIEEAGIDRGKAEQLAATIFDRIHDNVATKADVQASEAAIRGDLRAETAGLRGGLAQTHTELKAEITAQVESLRAELRSDITAIDGALRGEIASVRTVLANEIGRLDTRIERLDAKVVLTGHRLLTQLGGLMVVLTGVLFAALHYWPPGHG